MIQTGPIKRSPIDTRIIVSMKACKAMLFLDATQNILGMWVGGTIIYAGCTKDWYIEVEPEAINLRIDRSYIFDQKPLIDATDAICFETTKEFWDYLNNQIGVRFVW